MQRERNFKVYLNNPSMRAALFAPVAANNPALVGQLAESAIYSQWQHSRWSRSLRYARWRDGEVDIVYLGADMKPLWAVELKWSDRAVHRAEERAALRTLIARNLSINTCTLTSRTITTQLAIDRLSVSVTPTAVYCYTIGRNIRRHHGHRPDNGPVSSDEPSQPRLNLE